MGARDRRLALRLGAGIERRRHEIGADRGDVHERHARRDRFGDHPRPVRLHLVESLAPALLEDADEIADRVRPRRRAPDRLGVAKVRLDELDLADDAERLEEEGEVRPAHRDADAAAAPGEAADHVTAEEARTAEHGHELRRLSHRVHVVSRATRRSGPDP